MTHVDCGEVRRGRTRGFAIIKFSNKSDADEAIEALDGTELTGRTIEVRYERERS